MSERRRGSNSGFSMVDIIIAVSIMAILTAVLMPMVFQYIDKSKRSKDLETASDLYRVVSMILLQASKEDNVDVLNAWNFDPSSFNNRQYDWIANVDGETYPIMPVAWARGVDLNRSDGLNNLQFKLAFDENSGSGQINFAKVLADELVQSNSGGTSATSRGNTAMLRNTKVEPGKRGCQVPVSRTVPNLDSWIICRRLDTSEIEIWAGRKWNGADSANSRQIDMVYRLYPNPDSYYTK